VNLRHKIGISDVSLYLCIFGEGDDEEIAGWQLGHYSDFGWFRDTISRHLGASDFPILMEHSDCDGEWSVAELPGLIMELETIGAKFRGLPPEEPKGAFEHAAEYREGARSLYECFHNVDGENLFGALITLAREGIRAKRSISFQ
jgi:Immunity protein 70